MEQQEIQERAKVDVRVIFRREDGLPKTLFLGRAAQVSDVVAGLRMAVMAVQEDHGSDPVLEARDLDGHLIYTAKVPMPCPA